MGINDYFNDYWNTFDFILAVLSLILDETLTVLRVAKSLVSTKGVLFLRYTRCNKIFKVSEHMRKSKYSSWLFLITDTLKRIKLILLKTIMLFTSFVKIISVMFLTFYIWAVLSTQILHHSDEQYEKAKENPEFLYFSGGKLGDFQSFSMTMIALFQILTGSSWHMVVLYTEMFNGFWPPCLLLLPFHLFITFIIRSIILGFIWEMFTVVNDISQEQPNSSSIEGNNFRFIKIESLINQQVQKRLKAFEKDQVRFFLFYLSV